MTPWQFDANIATIFVDHARQHIPNYNKVIKKSVDVCKKLLASDSAIIDVGCATGETLRQLSAAGFTNLTGCDSSQPMLDQCQTSANLICSDQFPNQAFDGVICNWTLHFIKNKSQYLKNIYTNLNPGGFLILSEKTSTAPLPIEFYHDFKLHNGVSVHDVELKAQQVRDVMFIDSPEWYFTTARSLGFKEVYIIDADWCFTTFFCVK